MAAYKSRTSTTKSQDITVLDLEDFDASPYETDDKLERFLENNKKTRSQQQWGKHPRTDTISKYKGVSTTGGKKYRYWRASLSCGGKKRIWGKQFPFTERGEKDAARAYDKAAKELFGEHALTNQEYFGDLLSDNK